MKTEIDNFKVGSQCASLPNEGEEKYNVAYILNHRVNGLEDTTGAVLSMCFTSHEVGSS